MHITYTSYKHRRIYFHCHFDSMKCSWQVDPGKVFTSWKMYKFSTYAWNTVQQSLSHHYLLFCAIRIIHMEWHTYTHIYIDLEIHHATSQRYPLDFIDCSLLSNDDYSC